MLAEQDEREQKTRADAPPPVGGAGGRAGRGRRQLREVGDDGRGERAGRPPLPRPTRLAAAPDPEHRGRRGRLGRSRAACLVRGPLALALHRRSSTSSRRSSSSSVAAGELHPITHGPEAHPAGCYGPDGSYVLMTARIVDDEMQSQIELLEPGSASPRPLTPGPRDYAPTCAADGERRRLRDGSAARRRVGDGARSGAGAPSRADSAPGASRASAGPASGSSTAAPIQRGTKIWRVRADGTGRSPIGRGVLDETTPACSPDGGMVVYGVTEDYLERLYVRRFDGSRRQDPVRGQRCVASGLVNRQRASRWRRRWLRRAGSRAGWTGTWCRCTEVCRSPWIA